MGATKQRWTAEEEAALKAGVVKHGTGKWRTILMDSEFSTVLRLRSNVDLKDKWRNINVTAIWGSRQKAKLAALKSSPRTSKHEESSTALTIRDNEEVVDANPLLVSAGASPHESLMELLPKLGSLIMEAIVTFKEPSGSNRASIAMYIEDKHRAVPNLRELLSRKLKLLTASGKLIKVKHKYRIASISKESKGKLNKLLTESEVVQDLMRIQGLTEEEAAAAAAKAVAEAEVAIAEAEEASREAERAEAEAEAREVFARAAMEAFRYQST